MQPDSRFLTRALHGVLVVFLAYTAAFFLVYALPGDAASGLLRGASGEGTAQYIEEKRAELGLDRPVLIQYLDSLWKTLQGDSGTSYYYQRPALQVFIENFGSTLQLVAVGLSIALVGGVAVAVIMSATRHANLAIALRAMSAIGLAVPGFWLALMLVFLFAFELRLIPAAGGTDPASTIVASLALAIPAGAQIALLCHANLEQRLREPFALSVLGWGSSRWELVLRHGVRHTAAPVMTNFANTVSVMLGGTVMTETVFSRPGVGRVLVEAVDGADMPIVLVAVTVSSAIFVVTSLLTDLAYPLIDPRVRGR